MQNCGVNAGVGVGNQLANRLYSAIFYAKSALFLCDPALGVLGLCYQY